MTDDIVTRLRGELVVRLNGEPCMTFDALPVLHDAADEIERLHGEQRDDHTVIHRFFAGEITFQELREHFRRVVS